ncbi:hypothetical protein HF521_011517 [Silurus meridionalis]|uniref:Uncharacterized protein n=1 Tax=Silurus meridionalis TaxID=175797 RepID=A0A8T0AI65_SILME|nr:hypothetical protein HF521_011517 [Silurus meridionalis]
MLRLLHHCLIAVCLVRFLMRLPLCCAQYEYDTTLPPDYDYNATFEYNFFSNSSNEDLEIFIREKESEDETTAFNTPNKGFRTEYPSFLLILILTAHPLLRVL